MPPKKRKTGKTPVAIHRRPREKQKSKNKGKNKNKSQPTKAIVRTTSARKTTGTTTTTAQGRQENSGSEEKEQEQRKSRQKPHRFRPGTAALREIRKYQKTTDLLLQLSCLLSIFSSVTLMVFCVLLF